MQDRDQNRAALVVCSDAGWAWQSAFLLSEAIAADPSGRTDHHAYLIGDVAAELLAAFPERATLHRIDDFPQGSAFIRQNHIPKAAFLKIFALDELSRAYDRVLYLDGDVTFDGSPHDLFALNFGTAIAGVRDRCKWPTDPRMQFGNRYIAALAPGIDGRYFNSGVVLANGPVFAAQDIAARALRFFADHPDRCRFGDQSALNHAAAGEWTELSPGWNWQISESSILLTESRRPRLTHFTGPLKPWNDALRTLPPEPFRRMRLFLERHGLLHHLGPRSPDKYTPALERRRTRQLEESFKDASEKRDRIKGYIDRTDFADTQAGIAAYS